jgi:ParB family chromosome partitioning protein
MGGQAFEVKRASAFLFDPEELVIIGLDTQDGPEHPLYDERINLKLSDGLVKNIMVYGVIQPVAIVKDGDKAVVAAGRQRVRAARKANEKLRERGEEPIMVPAVLRRGEDDLLMGVSISENENRENDDPIVQAGKVQRYLDRGRSHGEAAVTFGVSTQTISNRLKLLDCIPAVKTAVKKGLISASAAIELSGLPADEQKAALDKMLESGQTTTKDAKKAKSPGAGGDGSSSPGKRIIRKVLSNEQAAEILGNDFIKGAMWAIGDLDAAQVKGLDDLLEQID